MYITYCVTIVPTWNQVTSASKIILKFTFYISVIPNFCIITRGGEEEKGNK